jgi:hypothetical protein
MGYLLTFQILTLEVIRNIQNYLPKQKLNLWQEETIV